MKKIKFKMGLLVLGAALLTGCGSQKTPIVQERGAGNKSVVCTTFPQYDWVMNLLGEASDTFDVTLLVKNSADIHNYQPSAQDMIAMKEADLFIYVGGESDAWVSDFMKTEDAPAEKSVSLVGALGDGALVEELLEGMEHDHDHDHEHGTEQENLDEHVWLSLKNAEILCQYISEKLIKLAPDQEKIISDNTAVYLDELHELDVAYREMVEDSARNTLIFGDRFPFRYLIEDYDLEYYAAFTGCNAEVEAGFDTIIGLAQKADQLNVPCLLVLDGSDQKLAEAILNASHDQKKEILVLDSMQSVSLQDIEQGVHYLDIMKKNLEVLRKALG